MTKTLASYNVTDLDFYDVEQMNDALTRLQNGSQTRQQDSDARRLDTQYGQFCINAGTASRIRCDNDIPEPFHVGPNVTVMTPHGVATVEAIDIDDGLVCVKHNEYTGPVTYRISELSQPKS